MIKKYWHCILLLLVMLLAGCGNAVENTHGGIVLHGSDGTIVQLQQPARRVYAPDYYVETVIMGLKPEVLLATSNAARNPELSLMADQATKYEHVADNVSAEELLKWKPDLIILREGSRPEATKIWQDLGIPVLHVRPPRNTAEIEELIRTLADALGVPERGDRMLARVHAELDYIHRKLAGIGEPYPRVFFVFLQHPNYGGKGSIVDNTAKEAKFTNVISELGIANGQYVGKETMIRANPDIYLIPRASNAMSTESRKELEDILQDPAFHHTRAYQNKQIKLLPIRYIYASHQNYVWLIEGLANAVHGDVFDMSREHMITGLEDETQK